jgi:hypothetical protein
LLVFVMWVFLVLLVVWEGCLFVFVVLLLLELMLS